MPVADNQHMSEALRLAELGRYSVSTNPLVGCVLTRQGEVVGSGYHITAGEGHAEANALEVAGEKARGATAYVTLEPCSFEGRTPSCADALIKAGVERVVIAMEDPDPRNSGKGTEKLQSAGIEVVTGVLAASAEKLNQGHVKRLTENRPYVRLKLAMSLDGKTALANGESKWITSPAARADVQKFRAMSNAIVTGVQTVIDDDPAMTVRSEELDVPHKKEALALNRPVYILDSGLRTPAGAQLLQREDTVVMCCQAQTAKMGRAEVVTMPGGDGGIDLKAVLKELADSGHNQVLFECGATLAGSLVAAGLLDELIIYVAPRLIGANGRSLLNLPEIDRMTGLFELRVEDIRRVGEDFRVTACPA